jgi:hypothetical protein
LNVYAVSIQNIITFPELQQKVQGNDTLLYKRAKNPKGKEERKNID